MTTAESHPESSRPAWFWNPATPVHFDKRLDTWHAFSYADVSRVLNDRTVFSSCYGFTEQTRQQANPTLAGMWAADGARHNDLRAAVMQPFRNSILQQIAPTSKRSSPN
jgi:cytochrome P450